jgi:hypothetical protein
MLGPPSPIDDRYDARSNSGTAAVARGLHDHTCNVLTGTPARTGREQGELTTIE